MLWKEPTNLSHFRDLSVGALFTGNDWGIVGDTLTVAANLLATALITYKAWSACLSCVPLLPLTDSVGSQGTQAIRAQAPAIRFPQVTRE